MTNHSELTNRAMSARTALLALCDALSDVGAAPSLPSPEATRPTLPVCAWPGCAALSDPRWYVYDMLGGRWPSCDGHGGKSLPVHPPAPVEPAKGEARAERIERCAANLSARLVDARLYTESGDAKYDSGWGVDEAHQRLIEAIEVALTPQVRS